jgi:hypothetical protein
MRSHVGIGIRAEHHGIHDAEDCGVRADAERERRDDDRGVAGMPPQRAQRVCHVGPDRRHEALSPLSKHGRFERDAALDRGQRRDQRVELGRVERRAIGVGEVLANLGLDLGAAFGRDAECREPPLEITHSRVP